MRSKRPNPLWLSKLFHQGSNGIIELNPPINPPKDVIPKVPVYGPSYSLHWIDYEPSGAFIYAIHLSTRAQLLHDLCGLFIGRFTRD